MIRNTISKVAPTATRAISNSTKTNAAISLESSAMPSHNTAAASSNGRFKAVAYTVLGSTAVVAGISHLLKDEVVYWTPNTASWS
ncbi:hypothetical protein BKA57DRAFT_502580 [Linnemannia elongata]|nr:hypothetical protein BKA57DRAFT_502580 [Linnemannia elongata]